MGVDGGGVDEVGCCFTLRCGFKLLVCIEGNMRCVVSMFFEERLELQELKMNRAKRLKIMIELAHAPIIIKKHGAAGL